MLHPVRIVVDLGSHNSFITKRCASRLGQTILKNNYGLVKSEIKPSNSDPILSTTAIIIENITSTLPTTPLPDFLTKDYHQYNPADPLFCKPGQVDFLLEMNLFPEILLDSYLPKIKGQFKLLAIIFGNVIVGKCNIPSSDSIACTSLFVNNSDTLSKSRQKFWKIEKVCHKKVDSIEDQISEKHFQDTHFRLLSGHYVLSLPLK